MSLKIVLTNRFKKDLKLAKKRGLDIDRLAFVVNQLEHQQPLAPRYRDHALSGSLAGFRECHIKPDWLLVYRVDDDALILLLSRTGSHSDLFQN